MESLLSQSRYQALYGLMTNSYDRVYLDLSPLMMPTGIVKPKPTKHSVRQFDREDFTSTFTEAHLLYWLT